ncbi:MAG TPA: hypothetical protein VKS79_23315 [Gemmataceae bacterium]|nr:hypothetical protein [Gemmataceae bacterium]
MSTATSSPTRKQLDELEDLLQRMLSLPVNPTEPAAAPPPPPQPMQPATGLYPATFSITADTVPPQTQLPAGSTPPPPPRTVTPPMRPTPTPPPAARPMPPVRRIDPAPGDPTWSVPLPPASSPPPTLVNNWPVGIEATAQQMRQAPSQRPITPPMTPPVVVPPPMNPAAMQQAANPFAGLHIESIPAPQPIVQQMLPGGYLAASNGPREPLPITHWPAAAVDWLCGNILAMLGPPGQWLGQGRGKPIVGWFGWLMLAGAIAWGVVDYMGVSW